MNKDILSRAVVLILVLVFLVMALPVSAADSVETKTQVTLQDSESEEVESESSEKEDDGTRAGEAYISVYWSSWLVAAGYGFFSGTITLWNSMEGIGLGTVEPIAEQQSGTLDRTGYDRVTFYGWVRCYNTEYDFIVNPTYYTEHFIYFTV